MGVTTFREAKHRLIELVKRTKSDMGGHNLTGYQGPEDPLAKHFGIKIEERSLTFDFGNYIAANPPSRPTPMIILDTQAAGDVHLNFTYYHEISHHIIRQDGDLYSFLDGIATQKSDFIAVIDRFANIGAAEFLIPSEDLSLLLYERGFSIQLIPELDQQYPASKPAIAIQLAQCASHPCFVVLCEYGQIPDNNSAQRNLVDVPYGNPPKLYVRYSSNSPSQEKYSIAKYSVIPQNHILNLAFQNQQFIKGRDRIPFKSGNGWDVDCEAMFYKGRVYGVFNISRPTPPSSQQPSLF
jgi:hypothetical protein